jgi:hypothetical protein
MVEPNNLVLLDCLQLITWLLLHTGHAISILQPAVLSQLQSESPTVPHNKLPALEKMCLRV